MQFLVSANVRDKLFLTGLSCGIVGTFFGLVVKIYCSATEKVMIHKLKEDYEKATTELAELIRKLTEKTKVFHAYQNL